MKVNYTHATTKEEAYQLAKAKITPEYIEKWKVKAELDYSEEDKIIAKGKGFTLTLIFTDSACEVDISLGLLLKPLKGMLTSEIEKQIAKTV